MVEKICDPNDDQVTGNHQVISSDQVVMGHRIAGKES